VAIAVFNKQVERLVGARVVKAPLSVVLVGSGGADSSCGAVLSVGGAALLAGLLGVSLQILVWCLPPHLRHQFLELQ